eukprot:227348_1
MDDTFKDQIHNQKAVGNNNDFEKLEAKYLCLENGYTKVSGNTANSNNNKLSFGDPNSRESHHVCDRFFPIEDPKRNNVYHKQEYGPVCRPDPQGRTKNNRIDWATERITTVIE